MLTHDPDLAIVIDSEQRKRACDFLGSAKRIMDGTASSGEHPAIFTKLLGSWKSDKLPWRQDVIVVSKRKMLQRKEESIIVSSVETGYTGGAPDAIGIDDPMSPESHNDLWMNAVVKHYVGLGPVLMTNGLFWICATRYDDADLGGYTQRKEGWHLCNAEEADRCIRAGMCTEATEDHPEPWHIFFRQALDEHDKSIDEAVWTTAFLHAQRKAHPVFFAAQYMNDPWSNPDASFQKEDFTYAEKTPPDVIKVLSSDIAWKTASDETERSGDFNTFILGEHQKSTGTVYISRALQGRWTMGEWGDELVRILRDARRDRIPISRFTYEELRGGAAGALETAVRSACQRWNELAPSLIKAARSVAKNAKIERIKSIAQYFQNHQVIFVRPCRNTEYNHDCPECKGFQILRDQLLKLGATLFDDMADAMADQFLPEVYTSPAVTFGRDREPPQPYRPYDDELKHNYLKGGNITDVDDPRLVQQEMNDLNKIDIDEFYPIPTQ